MSAKQTNPATKKRREPGSVGPQTAVLIANSLLAEIDKIVAARGAGGNRTETVNWLVDAAIWSWMHGGIAPPNKVYVAVPDHE